MVVHLLQMLLCVPVSPMQWILTGTASLVSLCVLTSATWSILKQKTKQVWDCAINAFQRPLFHGSIYGTSSLLLYDAELLTLRT